MLNKNAYKKGAIDILYFAYGSNLDEDRIKKRCPSAQKISEGELKGYKLGFQNNNRGKIVANIIESPGDSVKGIIYRIPEEEDWRTLDHCEGHPHVYKRQIVNIIDKLNGREIECITYIMGQSYGDEEKRKYGIPEIGYLRHILKGYEAMDTADIREVWDIFAGEEYGDYISKIMDYISNNNKKEYILFVYGSLKRGFGNHRLMTDAVYLGPGVIEGYDMYSLRYFPAIVEGNDEVYGELYKVSEKELAAIDELEGYSSKDDTGMYIRRTTRVQTVIGMIAADFYLWADGSGSLADRYEYIPEGYWEEQ